MIRAAHQDDIGALVEMGRSFHSMAPHRPMGDFDAYAVGMMLSFLIESPTALILKSDEGAIGGVIAPVYFNPAKKIMEEAFWWSLRGGRSLLSAFEKEASIMGADFITLSTLENEKTCVIDRVVTRMGFRPIERRYLKELS